MEFNEEIKSFATKINSMLPSIQTEEATKMSLIVPFFQILGYDVFNSIEFCPEYTADVGIKKGEKVDYAIMENGSPIILIECKNCNEVLDKHGSQLFRYFSTTTAKFGILTNGIIYKFFTDLEESNKMDLVPFLEIDMRNLKETHLSELKKFCKNIFNSEHIFSTAEELKYTNLIKKVIAKELDAPSDNFIKFILNDIYDGVKTQKVIDKFTPILKKAFNGLINDIVNQKISSALYDNADNTEKSKESDNVDDAQLEETISKIVTSQEEIESFYIIRGMLAGITNIENIMYRDTESYFGILYQDNSRKPICRINLDKKTKQLLIPDENKKFERHYIDSLNDLYKYQQQLIEVVKRYI